MYRICLLGLLLLTLPTLLAQSSWTLREVRIVSPVEGTVSDPVDLHIVDGAIASINPTQAAAVMAEPGQLIEGNGRFVMPGMVDGHIHHFQSGNLYARPDAIDLRSLRPYADELSSCWEGLPEMWQRYLRAGITRLFDVGGPNQNFTLSAQAEKLTAPSLYVAGPLISSYQPAALRTDDPPILLIRDVASARAEVIRQAAHAPAFIKIWYIVLPGQEPTTYLPVVEAVVEESHARNIPVAVHATQLETARLAVQAGADILVHSVDDKIVDTAFVQALLDKDVSYIPTLQVSGNYGRAFAAKPLLGPGEIAFGDPETIGTLTDTRHLDRERLPPWVQMRLDAPLVEDARDSIRAENLQRLYAAGVRIVAGTDAGNIGTLHAGSYLRELQLMEEAGMPPAAILEAATAAAAEMMGEADQWGQLKAGMVADFFLLGKNPLEDLAALVDPQLISKRGVILRPDELAPDVSPVDLAQRQLNAYNNRDIKTFAACYAPDVKVYQGYDKLLYTGRETLFQRYAGFFETTDALHCELVNRIELGETVVDREHVTGLPGDRIVEAIAVYTIKGGLIHEVHFFQP